VKNRLFTYQITVVDAEARRRAIEALPGSLQRQRITQGKLFQRIESALRQALQLHDRLAHGQVELFLYQDDLPVAKLWRGGVLVMSDGLAEPLYDAEIIGVIAHELGHSYFEDEMAAAQRQKDTQAMRVVELKCDAVAIVSLKLCGQEPTRYLQGLKQIKELMRRRRLSSGVFQSHPELVERELFSRQLIKSLGG
jgi:predicted Zn-dependent protease